MLKELSTTLLFLFSHMYASEKNDFTIAISTRDPISVAIQPQSKTIERFGKIDQQCSQNYDNRKDRNNKNKNNTDPEIQSLITSVCFGFPFCICAPFIVCEQLTKRCCCGYYYDNASYRYLPSQCFLCKPCCGEPCYTFG